MQGDIYILITSNTLSAYTHTQSPSLTMTTASPSDPTTMTTPGSAGNTKSSNVEALARSLYDRLASLPRKKTSTNYISLSIGYLRSAVQPAVRQWSTWSPMQRLIAVCIALQLFSGLLMTMA